MLDEQRKTTPLETPSHPDHPTCHDAPETSNTMNPIVSTGRQTFYRNNATHLTEKPSSKITMEEVLKILPKQHQADALPAASPEESAKDNGHTSDSETAPIKEIAPEAKLTPDVLNAILSQIDRYTPADPIALDSLSPEGHSALQHNTQSEPCHDARNKLINYLGSLSCIPVTESPKDTPTTMKNLLGSRGIDLYRHALAEEASSENYRIAVYLSATETYPGMAPDKKLALIIGGPSSSGKTYATKAITKHLLPKQNTDKPDYHVVSADGGVCRDVSQMRKLVIKLATNAGYVGISDLHNKSEALEPVKRCLRNAAIKSPAVGIAIPETFSDIGIPLTRNNEILSEFLALPEANLVFVTVKGADPANFQNVVRYMGEHRAFGHMAITPLDLNNPTAIESKKYGPSGFHFGEKGSEKAKDIYVKAMQNPTCMVFHNDLMLLKFDTTKDEYVSAHYSDSNCLLVSEAIYNQWLSNTSPDKGGLKEYMQHHSVDPRILTEQITKAAPFHPPTYCYLNASKAGFFRAQFTPRVKGPESTAPKGPKT